jgi:hypothetical protein
MFRRRAQDLKNFIGRPGIGLAELGAFPQIVDILGLGEGAVNRK